MRKTQMDFARLDCKFVRDSHARIISIRATTPDLAKEMIAEIAYRVKLLQEGKSLVNRPITQRWGQCISCGDEQPDGYGGDCGFCIVARAKYRALQNQ